VQAAENKCVAVTAISIVFRTLRGKRQVIQNKGVDRQANLLVLKILGQSRQNKDFTNRGGGGISKAARSSVGNELRLGGPS
jgi:hypothetical protein